MNQDSRLRAKVDTILNTNSLIFDGIDFGLMLHPTAFTLWGTKFHLMGYNFHLMRKPTCRVQVAHGFLAAAAG